MGLRRILRRNSFFLVFLVLIFLGAFFVSQNLRFFKKHHHESDELIPDAVIGDENLASLRSRAKNGINPFMVQHAYTIPTEVDYETMTEIMPHLWRRAIESDLPHSCQFITFDYKRDMDLGESMFIYASLYGVARKTKRVPFIDHRLTFPLAQIFQFKFMPSAGMTSDGSFFKHTESSGCCRFDDSHLNLPCGRKTILSGLRQNPQYFHEYRRELVSSEFVYQESIGNACLAEFDSIMTKNGLSESKCQLVGVHVRHPDEIDSRQKEKGHIGANSDYLKRAFEYFRENYSKTTCLVFLVTGIGATANRAIVPKLDGGDAKIIFVQGKSDAVKMCVLNLCHHTIMTTGPTGWWIAYLTQQRNQGRVVYPKEFAAPESELMKETDEKTYFLESWIGM